MTLTPLRIGTVTLKNNLILAPMAGITDIPFRHIAKEGGAGLVCTEMIASNALAYNDAKTKKMLALSPDEHPVSVQIFGSKPDLMAQAAKIVEAAGADIIDINFGCPVHKVVKTGAGAKMLDNTGLMAEIMHAVASSVSVPVTAKIRIGVCENENLAPAIVALAEKAGIQAVIIHGRSAQMHHKGSPNLKAIQTAVASAHIPIIGNGGIVDEKSAEEFLRETGCHGLMIGRAAVENPEIFSRIEHYFKTGEILQEPSWEKRLNFLTKHAALAVRYYGEKLGLLRLRKLAPYYIKGLPSASRLRETFNRVTKLTELDDLVMNAWRSPHFEER